MAIVATHLADTSALARSVHTVVANRLDTLRDAGRLATCSIIDLEVLIIAAAAERARVTLLHYDADFDLIASVTGQPCEWVVERGTID